MKLVRASALALLALRAVTATAQGTTSDSAAAQTPAARYAEICPGKRDAETGAIVGRVHDADDGTALGNATVVAEWVDINLTAGRSSARHSSASARTSGSGFYLLCGVPSGVRLNLRTDRPGYVSGPAQLALDERLISDLNFSLHRIDRIAGDTALASGSRSQKLAKVDVNGSAVLPSWMERSGFDLRRKQGMGAFVTGEEIGRHNYSELISILQGVRGIRAEYYPTPGGSRLALPFMMGIASVQNNTHGRCIPNFYLDGSPYHIATAADFNEFSGQLHPESIKGIEVYSSVGTIPAQYDKTSSTGCGSIVIWTR